jgi:hypothetical protein
MMLYVVFLMLFLRPLQADEGMDDEEMQKMIATSTSKFKADTGFQGTEKSSAATSARQNPVAFEKVFVFVVVFVLVLILVSCLCLCLCLRLYSLLCLYRTGARTPSAWMTWWTTRRGARIKSARPAAHPAAPPSAGAVTNNAL